VKTAEEQSIYTWKNIVKVRERGNFILLYQSSIGAEFIRKDLLSADEKEFLLSKNKKR